MVFTSFNMVLRCSIVACGTSGLFGGLFVVGFPDNILIFPTPFFVLGVVFLVVFVFGVAFFGLAILDLLCGDSSPVFKHLRRNLFPILHAKARRTQREENIFILPLRSLRLCVMIFFIHVCHRCIIILALIRI
jgi:hypothetical protein